MRTSLQNLAMVEFGLFLPQPALLFLSLYHAFPLHYIAPIVVILSASWGWFNYVGKSQQRVRDLLIELEELVDEFGRINFQQRRDQDDLRIVRLLDHASFGTSTTTTPDIAAKTVEKIKESCRNFQGWYFSMLHKVRVMVRRAGNLLDYDLIDVGNDFVDFYNGFVQTIAEEALGLVNKGELETLDPPKQIVKSFTINMSELRGRGNTLLKKMKQQGYTVSGLELKPFSLDLATGENNRSPVSSEESGTSPLKT